MAIMSEFLYSAMSNSSLTSRRAAWPTRSTATSRWTATSWPCPQLGGHHHRPAPAGARPHGPHGRLPGPPGDGRMDDRGPAIAADRETTLLVDPATGHVEVFATPNHPTPYVYFLRTPGPPEVCPPNTPLTYRNVAVYRIGPGETFDLTAGAGRGDRLHAHRGGGRARLFPQPTSTDGALGPAGRGLYSWWAEPGSSGSGRSDR